MEEVRHLSQEKRLQDPLEVFALDVLMGLTSTPKHLSPKYMYDQKGSDLFAQIMELDEYYPTRSETEILDTHKSEIVKQFPEKELRIIELGAGNGIKTKILLREFERQGKKISYIPVDISSDAVTGLSRNLKKEFPNLEGVGVVADYFDAIRWINEQDHQKNLVLFLGGNIGNFNKAQGEVFLKTLWNVLNPGDLVLTGFDLRKSIRLLTHAYNDSKGVTRNFNLNVLNRMNRELGADFDLASFDHCGIYNPKTGAMESYLLSTQSQTVTIAALKKQFHFKPYEAIHIESSYKYLLEDIDEMTQDTGFSVDQRYFDENRYFTDVLMKVEKDVLG